MGNINIQKLDPGRPINIVTRSESVSKRGIQVVSPIDGQKKIIDFGLDLKELNLTVYTNQIETFKEKNFLQLFSDDFIGEIKTENITISEYSSLPYAIVNINAIGEDSSNTYPSNYAKNIIAITGLDNFYNITYSTTHIENIGTSISIAVSTKEGQVNLPIAFNFGSKNIKWGDSKFKLIGVGKNLTRTTSSYTYSFTDPLNIILQKTVIISNISRQNSQFMNIVQSSDKVTFFSKEKFQELVLNTLVKGKIGEFLNNLISDTSITLNSNRETLSPIVRILQNHASDFSGSFANMFYQNIAEPLLRGGIFSVGSIMAQLLPIFGLELYYNDGIYSLEPPRFLFKDSYTNAGIVLKESDVISITVEQPKINIPSIIIPRIDFENMALAKYASKCSEAFATLILKELSSIQELPLFKIKTYDIPNILVPHSFQSNTQALFDRVNENFREVWKYYSAFAFKSAFNEMNIGTIELVFNPQITEPFKWYNIAGKDYFVTSINHSITRNNALTTLGFGGIYDEKLYNLLDDVISKIVNNSKNCGDLLKEQLAKKNVSTPLNTKKKDPEQIKLDEEVEP